MAKKQERNNVWIVIGLVLLAFYGYQTGFLGAVIQTCENQEPKDMVEFDTYVLDNNGTTVLPIDPPAKFALEDYDLEVHTVVVSSLGNLQVIDLSSANLSCSQVLARYDSENNDTAYTILQDRQVLLYGADYVWCNQRNNLGFISADLTTFNKYLGDFIVCTETVTIDYVDTEDDCVDSGGDWINDQCECSDGKLLEVGELCPEDDREDETSTSTPGAISSSPTTTTTATDSTSFFNREFTQTQKYAMGGIIILVLFLLYWQFEKGPNKGLVKRRPKK